MSDLLAEVDEMMRRERMEKLWKEHGNTLLAFVAFVILATAALSGYRAWNNSANEASTEQLITLLGAADFPGNIDGAELDMRGGHRGIALLSAAGLLLKEGKTEDAIGLYTKASEDGGIPADLRQLATLMQVRLLASSDLAPSPEELAKRLQDVAGDKGSPWQFYAHLDIAALKAATGNYDEAMEHLSVVQAGQGAPDNLVQNARALEHLYRLEQDRQQNSAPAEDKQDS